MPSVEQKNVLILVVVDNGLVPIKIMEKNNMNVLILVVVDNGLVQCSNKTLTR